MAFLRNIYKGLEEWKNNDNHKPLVIRGARQVGKTTVIREFGEIVNCCGLKFESA